MKIKLNKEQVNYLNSLEDTETKKQFLLDCFIDQCEAIFIAERDPVVFTDGIFRTSNDEIIKWLNDFGTASSQHYDDHKKAVDDLIVTGIAKIKTPTVGREKFDKFIEDNGLKKFTPPESLSKETVKADLDENSFEITKTKWIGEDMKSPEPKNLGFLSKEQLNDITNPVNVLYEFKKRKLSDKEFFEEVDRAKRYFDFNLLKEFVEYDPPHPDKIKKYTKEDLQHAFESSRQDIMGLPLFNDFEEYLKAITPN